MDQTNLLPYDAVDPVGQQPAPINSTQPMQVNAYQEDINSLLAQATKMANEGGPGANADKAQAWLEQQMQGMQTSASDSGQQLLPYDAVQPVSQPSKKVPYGYVKPIATNNIQPDSTAVQVGKSFLVGLQTSVLDPFNRLQSQFANWLTNPQNRETEEGGEVTPKQKAAAKLIGADVGKQWGPILKATPQALAKARDSAMQSFGLDPAEQAKRDEAIQKGEIYSGPIEGLLQHSAVKDLLGSIYNPNDSNTLLYHKVNEIAHLQDVVAHPDKYQPKQVEAAKQVLDEYKAQAKKGTWQQLKEGLSEVGKHPLALVNSLVADPELFFAPELKIGSEAYAAKSAEATAAASKAARYMHIAQSVEASADAIPDVQRAAAAQAQHYGEVAQKALEAAKKINSKKYAADIASGALSGAAINAGIAATQQHAEQGYVRRGSLAPAAIQGGVLGAGLTALAGRDRVKLDMASRVDPNGAPPVGPTPGGVPDVNADKPAGEPLSPNTPINKNSHVPYYGGVDASGKIIHLDESTPEVLPIKNMNGKVKNIPVLKTVAYHEQVEYPLMHMTGPISDETLAQLQARIGKEGTIPPEIIQKLRRGESLSYPEAHEIATWSENHLVRSLYNTDPKVYQEALKPHIKKVAEANKDATAADIPPNLDTKPYDDMGHPEALKGQGGKPENQTGKIDKRLLATGAAAGLGATAGAALAPQDQKKSAAFAGGLAGLFLGMNMWGDSIPRKGFGKQEGMFAGPRAQSHNSIIAKMAEALEREGQSPEDIHALTGLHRGAGGKWLHEISDRGMSINREALKNTQSLGATKIKNVLHHPELAKSYPGMMENLRIRQEPSTNTGGYYDPNTHMITLNDPSYLSYLAEKYNKPELRPEAVLAHEFMHAIQHYEGLPAGDSPKRYMDQFEAQRSELENNWERLNFQEARARDLGNHEQADVFRKAKEEINKKLTTDFHPEVLRKEAMRKYQLSAGEQQANNVQTRLDMTPAERLKSFPPSTMTAPIDWQHTRYNTSDLNYHELPVADHLKQTGEMDQEGNLHGLTLDEDKLPNESAVVERARNNDPRAQSQLFHKYMPRLERTMRSMMREAGPRLGIDAQDIASQAFMKALTNLDKFQGGSSFYTWLYSIARNEALNAIDKSGRQVPTTSMFKPSGEGGEALPASQGGIEDVGGSPVKGNVEAVSSTSDNPEAMATAQQVSNMVKYAISKLPQEIREAVKMKDLVGMSEQEIADAQGVPLGTVKSRLNRGRQMIQDSIKRGHGANFRKQGGFATPEQLKRLAKTAVLAAGGATLGAMYLNPDNKKMGAWAGAGLALVGGEVKWSKLYPAWRDLKAVDPRLNVNSLLNQFDGSLATAMRSTAQVQDQIHRLVPNAESQRRITHWLDGDRTITLSPQEYKAALIARNFYNSMGQEALDAGVLTDFLQNYVNHEWGDSAKAKALQEQIAQSMSTNMSPKDRHALARKYLTLAAGKAAGLVPRTENINDLIGIYSRSMSRAMANKTLLEALKTTKLDADGKINAVMRSSTAPNQYVAINHPQLRNVRVHPDIAPSLDFLFHTRNANILVDAAHAANTAIKRLNVSFSLFHAKNLIDAYLGATPLGGILKNLSNIATGAVGKSDWHKMYMQGETGDIVDMGLRNGLVVDHPRGQISDEDLKTGFYDGLDKLHDTLNNIMPGAGKPITGIIKLNKALDTFLWQNVHTALKGATFMNAFERLTRAHAGELLKDPNYKMPSQDELARQAASFANDIFGGLNWRRLADDATTKYGRAAALAMASPAGRRASQLMLFAPDWTYSTIRSFTKAFGEGSGLRGMLKPKTLADLHRQYIVRSALIYMTLYNGLNMAMSGHPIWDNKDPLTVDMGNGERMQANKHFLEVPHLLMNPAKFAISKLSPVASEAIEQILHKEYLTTGQMPDMKEGRLQHAAKRLMPFTGEALQAQGTPETILNALGFPVYGQHPPRTPAEVEAAAQAKKAKAQKAKETRRRNREKKLYGGS